MIGAAGRAKGNWYSTLRKSQYPYSILSTQRDQLAGLWERYNERETLGLFFFFEHPMRFFGNAKV
jgi:hypothetical protein